MESAWNRVGHVIFLTLQSLNISRFLHLSAVGGPECLVSMVMASQHLSQRPVVGGVWMWPGHLQLRQEKELAFCFAAWADMTYVPVSHLGAAEPSKLTMGCWHTEICL